MNYLVIDLEMCKVPRDYRSKRYKYANETIQIGAVLLDEEALPEFLARKASVSGFDELYLAANELDVPVRFDVAEVYDEGGSLRISYIENAFI